MLPKGKGTRWRRSRFRTAGIANTPPHLPWSFSGGSSRSEAFAGNLEKRFREDTFAKFTSYRFFGALAALGRGKPADRLERLQIAFRYELAVTASTSIIRI